MRVVIQRVLNASVLVKGETVGQINKGLLVLVGIGHNESEEDLKWIARKIVNLRLWDQDLPDGKNRSWANSCKDLQYEILLVSQFTLFANIAKGTKPDFHGAAKGDISRPLFDQFVEIVKKEHSPDKVQTGAFGEMMEVGLINDGPVTITMDSRNKQ